VVQYHYSFIYNDIISKYDFICGKNWMNYYGTTLDNNINKIITGEYKYYSKLLYDYPSFLDKDFEHFEHFEHKQNDSDSLKLIPTSYYYDKYAEYLKRYKTF